MEDTHWVWRTFLCDWSFIYCESHVSHCSTYNCCHSCVHSLASMLNVYVCSIHYTWALIFKFRLPSIRYSQALKESISSWEIHLICLKFQASPKGHGSLLPNSPTFVLHRSSKVHVLLQMSLPLPSHFSISYFCPLWKRFSEIMSVIHDLPLDNIFVILPKSVPTVGGIKTVTFLFRSVPFKRKQIPFLCSWKQRTAFSETRIERKRNGPTLVLVVRARAEPTAS